MIDEQSLIHWQRFVPGDDLVQVEKDLIISRILIAIFNDPLLQQELALNGSVAMQKFVYTSPVRYADDIDLVKIVHGSITPILDALFVVLNPWLGTPEIDSQLFHTSITYKFTSTIGNKSLRIKIDVNNTDHYSFMSLVLKKFILDSPWYKGGCNIQTYHPDELLSTKLHALYVRVRGRDLFDLARAIESCSIDINNVILLFNKWCERRNMRASRSGFEYHLLDKYNEYEYNKNLEPLLPTKGAKFNFQYDLHLVMTKIIAKITDPQNSNDNKTKFNFIHNKVETFLPSFNRYTAVATLAAATGLLYLASCAKEYRSSVKLT